MSRFEQIIDGDQIEQAIIEALKPLYPHYIDELAQQRGHPKGRGAYQHPRTWAVKKDFSKWPQDKLPCVLIISPGMDDKPRRMGDGSYTGSFFIATAVIVSARTASAAHRLAMRYGAALSTCILQNGGFGGALDGNLSLKSWEDEDFEDVPDEDDASRFLSAAKDIFTVECKNIRNAYGPVEFQEVPDGEATPDQGEWPTADPDKLIVDVTYKEDD